MLLMVDHVTRYTYDRPVRGVVQSHRLTPSKFDGQKTFAWSITVTGGIAGGSFRDGAGDLIQGWTVPGPVSEIEVRVQGRIETRDLIGVLRGHRELVMPDCYLNDTFATRADVAIMALADLATGAANPLSAAHTLSDAVAEAIKYRPGATKAQTTAAEALALGEGVCQDHAHVLISAARHAGIPARYVSGYLLVTDGQSEAAHAWAELHVAGLGWVGFDPANECCPDDRYIRLGSGLDAQDAAPIRGVSRGKGQESLDVTVAVLSDQQ